MKLEFLFCGIFKVTTKTKGHLLMETDINYLHFPYSHM